MVRSSNTSKRSIGSNSGADRRPAVNQKLRAGSLAHYEDPAYYTQTYRTRLDDVAFYVARVTKGRGSVLEYGIGNGRIALPLIRHGINVTGIDHSMPMLNDLRARLAHESPLVAKRLSLRSGDMRRVRLKKRFGHVLCTFNTALHLYTQSDVEQFFARVREHLADGGRFICDISVPVAEDLARDPERGYYAGRFRHQGRNAVVKNYEYFRYDAASQLLYVEMEFEPVDDPQARWITPLVHRQFFPQEWLALLHYNGLDVLETWGDFEQGAFTHESDTLVVEARLSREGVRV